MSHGYKHASTDSSTPHPPSSSASVPLVRPSNNVSITQKDRISGIWTIDTGVGTTKPVVPVNPSADLSLHSSSGIKAEIQVVANNGAWRPPAVDECQEASNKAGVRIVSHPHL